MGECSGGWAGKKTILGPEKSIMRILMQERHCGPPMEPRDVHCGWRAENDAVRAE